MYKLKTVITEQDVNDYINTLNDKEKDNAHLLVDAFVESTGCTPRMWGPSMIGFGKYHYKYKTNHEGDAMLTGFAMRKNRISLYLYISDKQGKDYLSKLGKTTNGVACVYTRKLDDISIDVMKSMIVHTINFLIDEYGENNINIF